MAELSHGLLYNQEHYAVQFYKLSCQRQPIYELSIYSSYYFFARVNYKIFYVNNYFVVDACDGIGTCMHWKYCRSATNKMDKEIRKILFVHFICSLCPIFLSEGFVSDMVDR